MKRSSVPHPVRSAAVGAFAVSALFAAGCAAADDKTTEPVVSAPNPMPEPEVDVEVVDRSDEVTTGINIDATLAELCGIDRQQTYFAFDSAKLKSDARSMLQELADCVEEEEKVSALTLVGHADPRGSESYNLWLGQDRADSVATALEDSGVDDDQLVIRSKGEQEAHDDPSKWESDRRVDIELFDGGAPQVETLGQGGTR